ncbi:hypothetical protein C8R43DRAFT_1127599 [Mycena crocata]|nr:hypothetical protein C8R43DRAFT_1127599 [Mycena crocata]
MPREPKEPDFYEVTEEEDGVLTCACPGFRQTGKTCEHIFALNLKLRHGDVQRHNDVETIRKIRGSAARGQNNNPVKEPVGDKEAGRQSGHKRRTDRTVAADLERFLQQIENNVSPWKSDSDSSSPHSSDSEDTDGNVEGVGIDDPLDRTGSQLSRGRERAASPLHPGRTPPGSGKAKGKKNADLDGVSTKGVVKFSNPPGPKRGHHNSLLTGSSPAKRGITDEQDEKERELKKEEERKAAEKEARREERRKRKEEKKKAKQQQRLADREPEDQADELQMFGGVDELDRWDNETYQLREDEGQGFTDIANALSACLGSGTIVLPSYFEGLARKLLALKDWETPAKELIDKSGADGPFSEGSLFAHLTHYAEQIDPGTLLFLHRDEDESGREHWLLFRHQGSKYKVECFDPLAEHKVIHHRRSFIGAMHIIAAYFLGEDLPNEARRIDARYTAYRLDLQTDGASCGFWATVLCFLHMSGLEIVNETSAEVISRLKSLEISGIKQHLKAIWTSWQVNEEGLEEIALNRLLKELKLTERHGFQNSCIASRPPWIARAEETVAVTLDKGLDSSEVVLDPPGRGLPPNMAEVLSEAEQKFRIEAMKKMADEFCLRLAGKRHKVAGRAAPLFLEHLHRLSSPDGWLNCDVINEWAVYLDSISMHTKVVQNGVFNQIRANSKWYANDKSKLEIFWTRWIRGTRKWFKIDETRAIIIPINVPGHWICAFVDFDELYMAIFDSWKSPRPVPNNDWQESDHAPLFRLIREWLQRLFVSLGSGIDWTKWKMDPCPKA